MTPTLKSCASRKTKHLIWTRAAFNRVHSHYRCPKAMCAFLQVRSQHVCFIPASEIASFPYVRSQHVCLACLSYFGTQIILNPPPPPVESLLTDMEDPKAKDSSAAASKAKGSCCLHACVIFTGRSWWLQQPQMWLNDNG